MGQSLIGVVSTYFQFLDIVFKLLPQTNKVAKIPIIIEIRDKALFDLYIDDYLSLAKTFTDIFKFLYKTYFLHIIFGLVYLIGKKTFAFNVKLDILSFKNDR